MNEVEPRALEVFARGLRILHQDSGAYGPLRLNAEQRIVLDAVVDAARVIVLKARQVGISTFCLLYDLAFALANPGIPICIVVDTLDKAKRMLGRIRSWCHELGIPLEVAHETSIKLWNGSVIDALSSGARAESGESRTGRSASYGLIHASELAFWMTDAATFRALTSTMLPSGKVVIESTASAADNLFRRMWRRAVGAEAERSEESIEFRGYVPTFLSVEMHEAYRINPLAISDARWELDGKGRGFTDRAAAAWWLAKLDTDFGGDVPGCLREYPVRADDAFSFAKGRWIFRHTKVDPIRVAGPWSLYLEGVTEPVAIGVDTGKGVGGDNSVIAVVGCETRSLVACWRNDTTDILEFTDIVRDAVRTWKPRACLVESNGVGQAVYLSLAASGLPGIQEQVSSEIKGEKSVRMRLVKRAIEGGSMLAGPELQEEILSSVRTEKGDWEGRDDLLNAASFALKYIEANPYRRPAQAQDMLERHIPDYARPKQSPRHGRVRRGY